jgi:antitoxin (DNA-binding transcriptional repressor) of toxin-antitoxin stability system
MTQPLTVCEAFAALPTNFRQGKALWNLILALTNPFDHLANALLFDMAGKLWLARTLLKCYFSNVSIITAKQLHQQTKAVLNQLEQGESLVITRNGRTIGRIEPLAAAEPPGWPDIMAEVWRAQTTVKSKDRVPNPVLQERQRRRR